MRRSLALVFSGILFAATPSWAANFDLSGVNSAPSCSGVYTIFQGGKPIYVGRSRVSILVRLQNHYAGRGSRCVDSQRGENAFGWTYEFDCVMSPEQLEANRIRDLSPPCNERGERDPAD
jgi:excinuclease UvrABC nuclease subunit